MNANDGPAVQAVARGANTKRLEGDLRSRRLLAGRGRRGVEGGGNFVANLVANFVGLVPEGKVLPGDLPSRRFLTG